MRLMQSNGRHSGALNWPGQVLTADDLRRGLNGHARVLVRPNAIVTPLAAEELRAGGIVIERQETEKVAGPTTVGIAQDRPHPLVQSARKSLEREGMSLHEFADAGSGLLCRWARAIAECVARGECVGGVIFCHDPGLVCCVANKVSGLRAVATNTVGQAAQATANLAANLLAVEMPGRTFFEVRQILRMLATVGTGCPDGVATTLQELEGHAHR